MKNTKVCPKCGGSDVVEVPGGAFSPWNYSGTLRTSGWGTARVDRWICCACGYCETWIEPEKLQKIRKNWKEHH